MRERNKNEMRERNKNEMGARTSHPPNRVGPGQRLWRERLDRFNRVNVLGVCRSRH